MKKVLFVILFTLFSLLGLAQSVTHQDWKCINKGSWGSYYWKVNRTEYADIDGKYWFYVICYSNSYFNTQKKSYGHYDKALTYLESPKITMFSAGYKYPLVMSGFLFDWEETQIAYFFSTSKNATFDISYNRIYPYDYSIKK